MDDIEFSNPHIIQNNRKIDNRDDLLPKEINTKSFPQLFLSANPSKMFYKINRYNKDKESKVNCDCLLKKVFLSNDNLKIVQKQLVLEVFKRSNKKYKIPFQDPKDIVTVMRYMYYEYALNLPYNIKEQVKELNKMVVDEVTPSVLINLDAYYQYLIDSSTQPTLIDLPVNLSSKGNRILPSSFIT